MTDIKVAIAVAEFNATITDGLLEGALAECKALGVDLPTVVGVPGAFELPVVAKALLVDHDCVIALGCVIEGETDHYTHIATQAAAGLQQVAVATGKPVAFGVLTVRRAEHAVERSRPGPGNKGAEAARAAIETARALMRGASEGGW